MRSLWLLLPAMALAAALLAGGCDHRSHGDGREVIVTDPDIPAARVAAAQAAHDTVSDLADATLRALAERNYPVLARLVGDPPDAARGRAVARGLLGERAESLVLERWDRQQMRVLFDTMVVHAIVEVVLGYRLTPNRPVTWATVQLHFCRETAEQPWRLCPGGPTPAEN